MSPRTTRGTSCARVLDIELLIVQLSVGMDGAVRAALYALSTDDRAVGHCVIPGAPMWWRWR